MNFMRLAVPWFWLDNFAEEQAKYEVKEEERAEDVKEEEARLADHKAQKRENRKRKKVAFSIPTSVQL